MKRIILVALLTLSAVPAWAQTYLTNTTLSVAITDSQTQIRLASGTSVQAGGSLYIDHEFMGIQNCANAGCTIINVVRQQKPQAHAASAVVYVATVAQKSLVMLTHAGAQRAGVCTLTGQPYLPIFDIDTGDMYACRFATAGAVSRTWAYTNVQGLNGAGSLPTAWP